MGYRENYEAWLRDFANDEATVADLQAIAGDEKEIEDRFYKNLSFGTAGMRGVLGAGIVTVRMLMDDKFKTADEIRRYTGLATLAVVPIEEGMVRENRKSKSRRKRR